MRVRRYVPGLWRGEKDGLHDLREEDWADILRKSRHELEEEDRKRTTVIPTPDKDAA